ncbi:hypothetical protein C0585_06265 [Candidatus Woesearchaeota archaeon]|nr:MAG: hypothetical protein C0585_06265 [Candidatus Woesearchaeota archaeon]
MKRLLLLSFAVVMLFSIAGCTTNNEAETFESPYFEGDSGLEAEFEMMGSVSDTSGVNEIWEDESFPIEVILKNKGEKDLEPTQVKVTLKGFAQGDFNGIETMTKSNPDEIEKVSEYLPEGGEDRLNFGNAQHNLNFDGFYDAIIQAEIRYYYETYVAVPQVCFKYDIKDDTVCTLDEMKDYYVSSAPIQATSVAEKPGGRGTIYLEIDVTNTDGFTGEGRSAVPGEAIKIEYDKIGFEVVNPNSAPNLWECTSGGVEGVARLTDGTATIRCKAPVPEDANYVQPFNLILKYDYVENIQENVRIKENME